MQQERAVGGVEHARARDPVHGVGQPRPVGRVAGLDGDVADRVRALDLHEVDRADRPARLTDRARDLSEHPRQVVDLHAQREAVLSARGRRHGGGCYAASVPSGRPARAGPADSLRNVPDELFLIDGNSLAYRAFFALPESIATSTGVPTNAIFGFASMLVKILTDYGPKATVVVWDAGPLRAQGGVRASTRRSAARPDLLQEQWPHLEPLVEAFGYRNLGVEGYEADDVIASIADRAREADPPIPVMVVTGDRDAYQLVDDGVRIMTTSRGITDTRVYDRQGVIDRYGIPPELVPDFIGLKGDTCDNIPGVPGIGDKTAADLLQRFGSLETRARQHRRDLRRQAQGEPDRARRRRPDLQAARHRQARHPARPFDVGEFVAQPPDRSRLRDVFREFELREPLRRLEEALGSADAAAPAPDRRAVAVGAACARGGPEGRRARCPRTEVAVAVRPPDVPEGALFADDRRVAVRRATSTERARCWAGAGPAARGARRRARRPPGDRARRQVAGRRCRRASPTTPRSPPTCSSRRAAPTRSASCARSAAWRTSVEDPAAADARAGAGAGRLAARGAPRARADRPAERRRAAARADPARDGAGRAQARHRAAGARSPRGSRPRPTSSSGDLRARRRGVHARLAQAAGGDPVRQARAVAQAPRQDRLLDRRARAAGDPRRARDHPARSSAGAS